MSSKPKQTPWSVVVAQMNSLLGKHTLAPLQVEDCAQQCWEYAEIRHSQAGIVHVPKKVLSKQGAKHFTVRNGIIRSGVVGEQPIYLSLPLSFGSLQAEAVASTAGSVAFKQYRQTLGVTEPSQRAS